MLEVKMEKLGPILEGDIELKKLTVLCGENNTGKTYASYTIYSVLTELLMTSVSFPEIEERSFDEVGHFEIDLDQTMSLLIGVLNDLSEKTSKQLYKTFSAKQETFLGSKVSVLIDEQSFISYLKQMESESSNKLPNLELKVSKKSGAMKVAVTYSRIDKSIDNKTMILLINASVSILILQALRRPVFLLPAERSGLNLFYKELNAARNELIQELGVELLNENSGKMVRERLKQNISPYPEPISRYLTFLNSFDLFEIEESPFSDLAHEIQKTILRGSYEIKDQQIIYKNEKGTPFHLHISSSTAKSLFGLVFYLTYMAYPGQYLIIDEPELNLHPDNQRKLAKILAKVANRGVHVILSTHSDYLIKEFNNLIMLSKMSKNREELMQKYGYEESQLLNPEDVSPVLFVDDRIVPMEIDPVEGIIAETFDKVINQHNKVADEIYYALQEEQDGE